MNKIAYNEVTISSKIQNKEEKSKPDRSEYARIPTVSKFKYQEDWYNPLNVVTFADNVFLDLINPLIDIVNTLIVTSPQVVYHEGFGALGSEILDGIGQAIKTPYYLANDTYDYLSNTPFSQQMSDLEGDLSNPHNWEKGVAMGIGVFYGGRGMIPKAQTKSDAATGAILLGGTQAIANKVIPHSWAESPETSALVADLIVTSEFFTGTGPESRLFGPEMASTQSLMDSHLTHIGLNKYLAKSENITKNYSDPIDVGFNPLERTDSGPFIEGFWDSGYNTAQFVGSAKFFFNIDGDSIEVVITNKTTIHSAFYHIPGLPKLPRKETPLGILGNVDQAYKFKLSKEEALKKGKSTRWFTPTNNRKK